MSKVSVLHQASRSTMYTYPRFSLIHLISLDKVQTHIALNVFRDGPICYIIIHVNLLKFSKPNKMQSCNSKTTPYYTLKDIGAASGFKGIPSKELKRIVNHLC